MGHFDGMPTSRSGAFRDRFHGSNAYSGRIARPPQPLRSIQKPLRPQEFNEQEVTKGITQLKQTKQILPPWLPSLWSGSTFLIAHDAEKRCAQSPVIPRQARGICCYLLAAIRPARNLR